MQTAVITGAGSGIGAALALTLARRGMRIVCADIDERAAAAVAREIRMLGREATSARADVTIAADLDALATDDVDLWINNAGIAIGGATHELGLDDWRRVVDVNLLGVVHGVHAIYPRMVRRRRGHIVNIASVAGLAPYPLALPYTTTKHAVVGLSLALRAEARAHGVRVGVACPGRIDTPIWERSEVRGALGTLRARLLARMPKPASATSCAETIADGIARDRAVIPVTLEAHVAWRLARMSPWIASRLASRIASSVYAAAR
ncbi:MAG: SDR family oxidoreductase [Myxococcota bacterium]|nr:SDR family oxidoreductase [Myxococcota bacterium]